MTWIILTVLFAIVFFIGVALIVYGPKETAVLDRYKQPTGNTEIHGARIAGFILSGVAVILFLVVTIACSVNTVGQRQVGIVRNFAGQITGVTGNGLVFVEPWSSVSTENVGLQREDFVLAENNSNGSAVSKDQQSIYADLTLNYQLNPDTVLTLYKTVGPNWKSLLIDSRVLQDFKEVTSTYTAAEITTKREELRQDTKQRLVTELGKYDITVDDFFVKNISYSAAYEAAITQKTIQVQKSLQADAKVAQAKAEASQNVALADGQARATLVKAQAEAKALSVKGKALRDNPEILQLEAIDKINPNATFVCQGKCPSFITVPATPASGK